MISLKAQRAKHRLLEHLSLADDEEFCRMIWATRELQTRGGTAYKKVFEAPPEAHTTEIGEGQYALPWTLETLVNEMLAAPKALALPGQRLGRLRCEQWATVIFLLDNLQRWENGEDGRFLSAETILEVIDRIGHQQFQWQRGDLNLPSFYRSARLYGGEKAGEHLRSLGVSLNALSAVGVALWAGLAHGPYVRNVRDHKPLGVSDAEQVAAMDRISAPLGEMRRQARTLRADRRHPAYAQSVLRRFPAISGMLNNDHVLVPLPELVLSRITSGVYYDVVGGGREVHDEIGRNFEAYALDLLTRTLPSITCTPEHKYRFRKNAVDTPDLLCRSGQDVRLVIECKATKMTFEGKFGEGDITENRGFDEVAKGAYQIWKYCAHSRLGLTGDAVVADAVGVVLTLDSWVQISLTLKEKLLVRARAMALEKSPEVEARDMCPIAFYPIENLEHLVLHRDDAAVLSQVAVAAASDIGRNASKSTGEDLPEPKLYPFSDELREVLPWLNAFEEHRGGGKGAG